MKDLVTKLGLHFMASGKNHSALADVSEENGDSESAAIQKEMAMSCLGMAEHCVSTLKAMEPEITKAEAADSFDHFLTIEE